MNGGIKTLELNQLYNMDCMDGMKQFPDKYFELAIVDPPYGIGMDGQKECFCKNPKHNRKGHVKKSWDDERPTQKYFDELFRISKNQIIWGGNYFVNNLNASTKGWVIWDKGQHGLTMSDAELAFTSFNCPTRVTVINRGVLAQEHTFHPTQKPTALYKWLLKNYAKQGDKILDTHVGSASSLIACYDMGFDYCGFEIDKDYFDKAQERLQAVKAQVRLF
jgi:site-specific DNA-methyltransferase (adenine-specific)